MFARFLAVTLGCLMHFSLCTGGSFAVFSAGIDAFAQSQSSIAVAPMSYGSIGYLSCASNKRASDQVASGHVPGCTDSATCLQREFSRKREQFTVSQFVQTFATLPAFIANIIVTDVSHTYETPWRARIAVIHPGISSIVKME